MSLLAAFGKGINAFVKEAGIDQKIKTGANWLAQKSQKIADNIQVETNAGKDQETTNTVPSNNSEQARLRN